MDLKVIILPFLGLLTLVGCDEKPTTDGITCTANVAPAITIDVIDKATGDFIACDAKAVIEDTGFSVEIPSYVDAYGECDNTHTLQVAHERSGVYDVHVFKDGYLDWSMYSIEVTSDICHVNTVHIIAELEK